MYCSTIIIKHTAHFIDCKSLNNGYIYHVIEAVSTSIPRVKWIPTNLMLGAGSHVIDLHPTFLCSRSTPCRLLLQKPEINAGGVEHLVCEEIIL